MNINSCFLAQGGEGEGSGFFFIFIFNLDSFFSSVPQVTSIFGWSSREDRSNQGGGVALLAEELI